MKELDAFAELQLRLLEEEAATGNHGSAAKPSFEAFPEDRVAFVAHDLLTLAVALRSELPDTLGFVHIAAVTATEVARLIAPRGTAPAEAVRRLTTHQQERFAARLSDTWKVRGPVLHLGLAFWQLAGLAREVRSGDASRSGSDGQLEEHAADLANYLLFTVLTSGAWDLARRDLRELPAPGPSPRPGTSPGVGLLKGVVQ